MSQSSPALITGAGGFCARELARVLADEGRGIVVGLGRRKTPGDAEGLSEYVVCDVTDAETLASIVRRVRPARVFHLAATSGGTRSEVLATNVQGTVNVLEAVRTEAPEAGVAVVGSAAEYGPVSPGDVPITEEQPCRPQSPYGESKLAATQATLQMSRERRVRAVVARPFNMIGVGMPSSLVLGTVVKQIQDAMKSGQRPAVVLTGPTEAQRDFVRVEDVAVALVRMLEADPWGEVFNLCTGVPVAVSALLATLAANLDWPVTFGRRPDAGGAGAMVSYGSHAKATAAFGFAPQTDLTGAIRHICQVDLGQLQPAR